MIREPGSPLLVDVAFKLNVEGTFQYRCPPEFTRLAKPGMRVLAPLNRRTTPGVILAVGGEPKVDRLLSLSRIPEEEPLLDEHLIEMLNRVAGHYLSVPGMVLRAAVPGPVLQRGIGRAPRPREERLVAVLAPGEGTAASLTPRQRSVLDLLGKEGGLPAAEVVRRVGGDYRTLRSLERRGFLVLTPGAGGAESAGGEETPGTPAWPVDPRLTKVLGRRGYRRLLFREGMGSPGVEALLGSLGESLGSGGQGLVLVPEISLTQALVDRLRVLFPGRVAVFHSRLSEGQRTVSWLACKHGEARVAVGSRSAVFAPLPALRSIVVLDEHDDSYKSGEAPHYHARDVAVERARLAGVPVVVASRSPSVEMAGAPGVEEMLPGSVSGSPRVEVVNLAADGVRGASLSGRLRYELRGIISRKERAILFVNRKGVAAAAFCAECGHTPRCPVCTAALAWRSHDGALACRLCGHREDLFLTCPECGSAMVRLGSPGTQGVERELRGLFPGARVARIDTDSVDTPGKFKEALDNFDQGRLDVLVGTILLGRRQDWRDVALVGVVETDTFLHLPDFRASERTYRLLMEVRSWARPGRKGLVVVQTRYPDHYAVQAAALGRPELFYRQELELRRETGFPPSASLVLLALEDDDPVRLDEEAASLKSRLEEAARRRSGDEPEILGPHQPSAPRRGGLHRRQILVKARGEAARELVREALDGRGGGRRRGSRLLIDVDPVEFG